MPHSMDPSFRGLRALRVIVITMIWGMFAFTIIPVAIYTLPDLEAAWYPPITHQRVYNKHLKPDNISYLLWNWSFIKQRRAEPKYITFMAYLPETPQERYAVDTYIGWDCVNNFRTDRTSNKSDTPVVRNICIKLPPHMIGREDAMIDGVFDFRVGHDFYTVPVKVPSSTDSQSIPEPIAAPK